jgi:hypothetical protein
MTGSVNLPVLGRVDKRSFAAGAAVLLALLVLPKVRDYTVPVVNQLQNMLGQKK